MISKELILECLRKYSCRVRFNKKNGEDRMMYCTLKKDLITIPPKGANDNFNDAIIRVWDIDVKGWRSFRIDSIHYFETPSMGGTLHWSKSE